MVEPFRRDPGLDPGETDAEVDVESPRRTSHLEQDTCAPPVSRAACAGAKPLISRQVGMGADW